MRLPGLSILRGVTVGDVLILLAAVSLAAALLYPTLQARSFRRHVGDAIADVDAVSSAARAVREATGTWPQGADPGTRPPELTALSDGDSIFDRPGYTLGWSVWDVVDSVPAPAETGPAPADAPPDTVGARMVPTIRRVGGVSVSTGDSLLLAELTVHYAEAAPLIIDTMWLMVLPARSPDSR